MTENELRDYCARTRQPPANHPYAWPAFVEIMRERQYGYDATTQAWFWFLTGWSTHRKSASKVEHKG